jgi:ABC-type Zn uptake system ZnuABC Zn-binding protein ZnuA
MPLGGEVMKAIMALLLVGVVSVRADAKLKIVATTTLVGDAVRQVAGDFVDLRTLLPPGCDPHAFEATPRDAAGLADADIIFISGVGLENTYLPGLLSQSKTTARVVEISDGIALRTLKGVQTEHDPHVWFNPLNVKIWAQQVERTLQHMDPDHAVSYQRSSAEFQRRLDELDAWAAGKLSGVNVDRRKLVTDHDAFGYFADRYGYKIIGAVIPGSSTGAEPSARELARLEDVINKFEVKAVFVGRAVNADVARRVAADTGARLVSLDIESLPPGADYFSFMTNMVDAIVQALK